MRPTYRRHEERGAILITTSLVLLFLLGFIGIALDFGHLFVTRSELQTAVDSCALAGAQELGQPVVNATEDQDYLQRLIRAARLAGNMNRVNFQSATWDGQGLLTDADVTLRDANYVITTSYQPARYVECRHTQPGIRMWLLHAMGAFSGNTGDYPATRSVVASAVATRASAQTTCPLPLAMKPKGGGSNYGFTPGEWVPLLLGQNAAQGGEIGWANLDGSNSASETEAEMRGRCSSRIGDQLGTPGVQSSIADAWNARFGLYRGGGAPTDPGLHPDYTGYAYTGTNWPARRDAYADFLNKRAAYAACSTTGRVGGGRGAASCESITGLSLNGFSRMATAGAAGDHAQYGANRRIGLVPVVDGAGRIADYACMLMLQPMPIPMADVYLEYLGNASATDSPCTTSGLAGGTAGPLVPVLVR